MKIAVFAPMPSASANPVWPGFFVTMGIPVIRGRDFDERVRRAGTTPAVINRVVAEEAWPGQAQSSHPAGITPAPP